MTESLKTRPVLVVDYGAQYAQLIARRVREAKIYSEVVPHTMPVAEILAKEPAAVILSGGPSSVYAEDAPSLDVTLLEAGVPVFGMCYGFQAMVQALGGTVERTGLREYGSTRAQVSDRESTLFNGQPAEQSVWMSHGDSVTEAPEGMRVTASTSGAPVAAFEDDERRLYGVQWHPEVLHSTFGQPVLENFLLRGAGLSPDWTADNVIDEQVDLIRETVGEDRVLCALSGGRRLLRRGGARAARRRRAADLRLRRPRPAAAGRGRAGRAGVRRGHGRQARRRRRQGALPRRAGRGHRPRGEAQDHRPRVHPRLRAGGARRRRRGRRVRSPRQVARPGHALPGRRRVRRRHRRGQHQEPPQRRRPARRPAVQAHRAAARPLQGRGASGRP
ncbi:GMP synthase [Janibacter hoylei PVAS-1]|uniref:Glutamine amidotransferase n=1 Tax=Janibacter hoylei PVAS-1 TaxID=1210046 RepID=K1ETP4_9MICO|nr:GMP synthase [Janibacter hoylei PVAS-1]